MTAPVRRGRNALTCAVLVLFAGYQTSLAQDRAARDRVAVTDAQVRAAHAAARPLDAHADILVSTTPEIYRTDDGVSQLTPEKLTAGGMAVQTLALQAPTGGPAAEDIAAARAEIDAKLATVKAMLETYPDRMGLALSAADIDRLHADGKVAIVLGFQNAYGLGTDPGLVDRYVGEGVRVFAFNHAGNNAFSDSSRPSVPGDEANGGLSPLGREAVRRLNDLGVVIDVSQLTPRALMQTIALSRAPVVATHSAVRTLVDETRNLLDDEIDAIAAGGGAVCIPPFNTYLAARPPEFVTRLGAIRRSYGLPEDFRGVLDDIGELQGAPAGEYMERALAAVPRADLDDYVDHIDYVVARVGVEHVCIGTDFDHGAGIVGYADAGEARNLTRALLERGYSAADVAMIWSGNFLRVMRAAEAASRPAFAADLESLAERVRILEDREDIRTLILAYGHSHDHRDYRSFANLFAGNGEWIGGFGSARGPEAIFRLLDESIGHNPLPEGSGTYHILTNEQIEIDGDRASATTKWFYLTPGEDGAPKATFLGHYDDQFVRENGEWKFLRRQSVSDISPLRR